MLHCRLKNAAQWAVPEPTAAHTGQSLNVQLVLQVVPCLALHDTMRHVKSDVASVGFGGCMGMAGFLLAVGKKVSTACTPLTGSQQLDYAPNCRLGQPSLLCPLLSVWLQSCCMPAAGATGSPHSCVLCVQGKRYVLPNTRIMLHHPSGTARGQASDIQNEARELMRIRGYINKVLSEATGKPIERVSCVFDWMLQVPCGALAMQPTPCDRLSNVWSRLPSQHYMHGASGALPLRRALESQAEQAVDLAECLECPVEVLAADSLTVP